jgi:hypothetical protein
VHCSASNAAALPKLSPAGLTPCVSSIATLFIKDPKAAKPARRAAFDVGRNYGSEPLAGITTAKKKSNTGNDALIQDVCLPSAHHWGKVHKNTTSNR